MALFFTLFVFASSLSAQPTRMWQRSGVPNGATQLVVEPTSGVMAFTKGTDEWSQVMIRYPDGEVQTRDLPGAEPKLHFAATLVLTQEPSAGETAEASASAFQLLRRMQPCDSVLPILDGSGVPWMP